MVRPPGSCRRRRGAGPASRPISTRVGPYAESGPPSNVIVQGCSHPTTIGAGFDAEELAALAARLVVQTLEPEGGYPDADWDHAAVNFRRGPDDEAHPRFAAEKLERRGGCERCTIAVGSTAAR